MRSIGLALLTAACVAGCDTGRGANDVQPNAAAGASVNAAAGAGDLTPAWLAGRWQAGETGSCGPDDTFFALEADGRYAFTDEQGRWSLEGDRLQIEVTQESSDSGTAAGQRTIIDVRRLGPDAAELTPNGGRAIRVSRCRG